MFKVEPGYFTIKELMIFLLQTSNDIFFARDKHVTDVVNINPETHKIYYRERASTFIDNTYLIY